MGLYDRSYYRDEPAPFMSDWTAVMTIIVANIAVWVTNFLLASQPSLNDQLALQSTLPFELWKFWEPITYGFAHDSNDPWHLVFNMLALFFFGRQIEQILGRAEFFRFYFSAIVIAGLVWLASVHVSGQPAGSLIGASGAVMAVMALFIWSYPRETVMIWGVLPVPAWALGILYFVSDVGGAASGGTNVAHVAHLAGATFGAVYAWQRWNFGDLLNSSSKLFHRRPRMRIVRPEDSPSITNRGTQEKPSPLSGEVDRILEKISRSGEASLTDKEREALAQASRQMKDRMR